MNNIVRYELQIPSGDVAYIENINFFVKRGQYIELNNRIDLKRTLRFCIRADEKKNNADTYWITVVIDDEDYPEELIVRPFIESKSTYIKVYKLKCKDTTYYIDLKYEKDDKDLFKTIYHSLNCFQFICTNISNDVDYLYDLMMVNNLNDDIELMKFSCACLAYYHKLDDKLIETIKSKLEYFGYDLSEIRNTTILSTAKDYKHILMDYLLRKLYDYYDDIDKDKYLEEYSFFENTKEVRNYFNSYINKWYNSVSS